MGRTASTRNEALCGDRACRVREVQARVRFVRCARSPLRRSCVSRARNAGGAHPSAEIVRVECTKSRRECDLSHARATLCGDHACRVREMQAGVRFARRARNPLRVEGAKCRRECDLSGVRATLCGDRACRVRNMQARVRFRDLPLHFWRKSRTKRLFWRLDASLLEEVSYETLVLGTFRFTFGGSLVRNGRFGDFGLRPGQFVVQM